MEIRVYEPSDKKAFLNFYEQLYNENHNIVATKEEISKKMEKLENNHKYEQVLVALDDENIVGFLAIKKMHFEKLRHTAKFTMGVLEDYQEEEGVGSKLVERALEWSENNDIKRLEIHVVENDSNLEDLLSDLDFSKESIRKSTIKIKDDYHDEIVMVKKVGKR
jgi:N-acetylglutamate synthase-like GNAT family acetyltransferase